MSVNDRRSACREDGQDSILRGLRLRSLSIVKGLPFLLQSKHARAAILAVHGPFDEPPLLQSIEIALVVVRSSARLSASVF